MSTAPPSERRTVAVAVLFIIAAGNLMAVLSGWMDAWLPTQIQAWFVVIPFLVALILGLFWSITFYSDVILLRKAIAKLRYGDWDFFAFVVLDRPVRSSAILQEPGILYLFGHLLRRIGDVQMGEQLINRAVEHKPQLADIPIATKPALSPAEEEVIAAGVSAISAGHILLRIWNNRRLRYGFLALAILLLLLFYAMHLVPLIRGH